jgi:lipopolysaccharide biosynthesis regulator YciM
VYFLQNDLDNALKYWNQGFELAKVSSDPNIYAQIIINQGKYFIAKNQIEKGLGLLKMADSIASRSSELYLQILSGKSMVTAYKQLGKNDSIAVILKRIMQMAVELKNRNEQSEISWMMADFMHPRAIISKPMPPCRCTNR